MLPTSHKALLILKKVQVHNLKSVSLELPHNRLIVFSGVSGSGKSSMAFDTIYAEGQRRYIESLSVQVRRHMESLARVQVESAEGISPTISIEQKTIGKNPRSTVGTMTEIYDYLRVLFARLATPHCPQTGLPVSAYTKEKIIASIQMRPTGQKIEITAIIGVQRRSDYSNEISSLIRHGFTKAYIDDNLFDLNKAPKIDSKKPHTLVVVIDKITVSEENNIRIAEAVSTALKLGEGKLYLADATTPTKRTLYSTHGYSPEVDTYYAALEPSHFSYNHPTGMCLECKGLGYINGIQVVDVIIPGLPLKTCFKSIFSVIEQGLGTIPLERCEAMIKAAKLPANTPFTNLPEELQQQILFGSFEDKKDHRHFLATFQKRESHQTNWPGLQYLFNYVLCELEKDSYVKISGVKTEITCPYCAGGRLRGYSSTARFKDTTLINISQMSISEALAFFKGIVLDSGEALIGQELLKELCIRLGFLIDVGIDYLTLNRPAPSLSGGEAQRVRLAAQVGCGLVGVTYILDEPSIGLHPRDNTRLIHTLKSLRDSGNTVIVVEHDEETILAADYLVDFGPGAGAKGGEVVYQGAPKGFLKAKNSITASFLSGREEIPIPTQRRQPKEDRLLQITGAYANNLKNIDVTFPLESFVAVVGVSGSGKSTLITDILTPFLEHRLNEADPKPIKVVNIEGAQHLKKVIAIDQSPIGRTPRSTPSTYIKLFDDIRNLFSELPESKMLGYLPGRFSFNTPEGTCKTCHGFGMVEVDMDFLDDAWVPCTSCYGQRYESSTLTVTYKGKNIHDVLEMSVDVALEFFQDIPSIKKKLDTLQKVGLGYMQLGQSSTTLSGGEAQRIKLAKELSRPSKGGVIYILDEPTTGLHIRDVKLLLNLLHEFVVRGNTVVVIEHQMDVVKTADWVIELGPEGGKEGGYLIAEGTPEEVAKLDTPTGLALKPVLNNTAAKRAKILEKATGDAGSHAVLRDKIQVFNACQHNLKSVCAEIPRYQITVCTGPSGSGKSSFAFDTVYAEGQRRYSESLSAYARQFIQQMPKPKVERIEGLSPAIAIEQRSHAGSNRSTVGTLTEIYDYLRVFVSQHGTPHSPETGNALEDLSASKLAKRILTEGQGKRLVFTASLGVVVAVNIPNLMLKHRKDGYLKARINNTYYELDPMPNLDHLNSTTSYPTELVIDRLKASETNLQRMIVAIEKAVEISEGTVKVYIGEEGVEVENLYHLAFADPKTGETYPKITSQMFAFNTELGMCPTCLGSGTTKGVHLSISNWEELYKFLYSLDLIPNLFDLAKLDYSTIFRLRKATTPDKADLALLNNFLHGPWDKPYRTGSYDVTFKGVIPTLEQLSYYGTQEVQEALAPYTEERICSVCHGGRINPLAAAVKIGSLNMTDFVQMPIEKLLITIQSCQLSAEEKVYLEEVQGEILARLQFLCNIGLGYLSLNRTAPSLSGGEAQRIRLARQLGSGVTGVLYVLDEPTIGLHPHDNIQLNHALTQLKDLGNTLLLVEHDPLTIEHADYILDFGPSAGMGGGQIIAQGSYKEILENENSLTGNYLSRKKVITRTTSTKKINLAKTDCLMLRSVTFNNLKSVSVDIPLNALVCVTGVSGSGKSSLIGDFLAKNLLAYFKKTNAEKAATKSIETPQGDIHGLEHFSDVVYFDQAPMGTTSRSDVGSYSEIFPYLRVLYTAIGDKETSRWYTPSNFSANSPQGMCSECKGMGYQTINLQFLPEVNIECSACHGFRLRPESLQVKYKGYHFGQLFNMTIDEAKKLFSESVPVSKILNSLIDVGLGYLTLGQEIATLSGGEAQRLRLSTELINRKNKTLYILDEPTTGLHFEDIAKLLPIFETLIEMGHSLLIVEHHCDIIKNADYMIELGPEPGERGGEVIFMGSPDKAVSSKTSITGRYLV